jgi:dUTP pyrophosphatase
LNRISVKIKSVHKDHAITFPGYATPGSAGVDLQAFLKEELVIQPGEVVRVPTGIAIELPNPYVGAFVFARSGLASKYGLALANGVGVIDSDYRGEIQVALINHGAEGVKINNGDRIAQMVFMPIYLAEFQGVEELEQTNRGSGGFGSTGVNK